MRRAFWRGEEIAVKLFDYFNKFAEREITHLARLKHENIIKVYGTSSDGEDTYLLMEYVDGGSLHDLLHGREQRKFSVEEAVNLARQCAKVGGGTFTFLSVYSYLLLGLGLYAFHGAKAAGPPRHKTTKHAAVQNVQ